VARTAPGTWREIIARFEHEFGEPAETDAPAEAAEAAAADQRAEAAEAAEMRAPAEPAERPVPGPTEPSRDVEDEDDTGVATPVAWEFETMTTPDYTPPRSIHDPEHDSWPVEAADGDAMPAWSDDAAEVADETVEELSAYDEIGEMILDQVVTPDPWDVEPEAEAEVEDAGTFPLNAFIVPAGVQHMPRGYDDTDVAHRVAHRLDELAQQLRDGGLGALGTAGTVDELSRVLAAIVTGYVSRDA
jgi:hypothetical protein